MKKLTVLTPERDVDALIRRLIRLRCVEVRTTPVEDGDLLRVRCDSQRAEAEERVRTVSEALPVLNRYTGKPKPWMRQSVPDNDTYPLCGSREAVWRVVRETRELDVRVEYLHSDVDTLDRIKLIRGLRTGEFDVLVGINLLREGLDMPEVALVAILDADKEGFLRSETSLVQTIGRAARNVDGRVIMYADVITDSMMRAIQETNRRRALQQAYNEEHHITPQSVRSAIRELMEVTRSADETGPSTLSDEEKQMAIDRLEERMIAAANNLDFEKAAKLRDPMLELKGEKVVASGEKSRSTRRRRARH